MPVDDPVINLGEQTGSHQMPGDPPDSPLRADEEPRKNLQLTAVVRDVLSGAMRTASAEGGFILVLDEGGRPSHWFILQDEGGKSVPPAFARAMVERGIVGWVIEQQQGDVVDDLASDPRWLHLPEFPVSAGQGSALCLPLLVHGRAAGVLTLVHHRPGFFEPRHLDLLRSSGERAALSIENARLYEMLRRRVEGMTALYEVALNLSGDQPLGRLLDTIVAYAMDLLDCKGGGLFLWREDEGELELVAAYDPEIDLRGRRVAPGEGLVGRVFETGTPVILDEHACWPHRVPCALDEDVSSGLPATAAIAVPLVWEGKSLGVLVGLDRTPGRVFDHGDQHLLTLLADQAAAAIANAQLHRQTARRLDELAFLNETIRDITATFDLEEIFAILTQRIIGFLEVEACTVALVDRETQDLVFHAASGDGVEMMIGERVPWGRGIVGAAAQSGQPVNVPDAGHDERYLQEIGNRRPESIPQCILAVPMINRGQVVGVVEGFNMAGGFRVEDERLLGALANCAASAVENANLVSGQQKLEELRDNLTQMIVHDLRSPVGTISNSLQLLKGLWSDGESSRVMQLIDVASRATRRLLNLVDSLLDIHRLEAGQELADQQLISIKALIRSATDQVAFYAQRKRIRLQSELPDRLPVVMADRGMIERVLVNLMSNALRFTPVNGEVSVSAEAEEGQLYVRVRDEGPGVAPKHQRQIFEKYSRVQVRNEVGGIGLGLAFCRLAVEAHGGRIWVESHGGRGSVFVFSLPLGRVLDGAGESAEP